MQDVVLFNNKEILLSEENQFLIKNGLIVIFCLSDETR